MLLFVAVVVGLRRKRLPSDEAPVFFFIVNIFF